MEKKNDISIRLNGKEKSYYEQKRKNDFDKTYKNYEEVAAAKEENKDEWVSTFDKKEDRVEPSPKVVDLGHKRKEKEDSSLPFWDDGKSDRGPRLPPFGRKKKRPIKFSFQFLLHSVFLSIVAAVVVGSAFGLILLNIFTGSDTPAAVNGTENGAGNGQDAPAVTEDDNLGYAIPSAELYVVQGGAFSTTEKADEVRGSFQSNGLPAVMTENTDPFYLFIGVGNTQEDAEKIADVYEEQSQETYIKGYGIASDMGEVSEEWAVFMELGISWMEQAATLSAKEIAGDSIADGDIEEMQQMGQQWKAAFNEVEPTVENDPVYELGEKWLETGEPAFQVFTSSILSSDIAWEAQNRVLETLLIYEELVNTIVESS